MRAELTSLFGLDVYTDKGKHVGKVNDVVLDADERRITGLAISDINPDLFDVQSRGIIIPYRWVLSVGDVVVVKQITGRFKQEAKEE
ncbi:MAG: PRC-barrel domain-containing protein [Euryarchaeota archaeon]|nr:PRC-barrel domain-containing protein [Euryarchaeota archaeon]MDI6860194.1 PRC-barrel domain-containing protein [Methanocellales archaeon]MDI6902294.1 PRC-barrel domain-containing protein [Methanocellales archaeon]